MGLGSAAADSLTSGNRNLSQAYTNSSTAPWPCHGSPLGWQGAPANTPSLAAPMEQHSMAGSRGSHGQALLRLMQGLSPSPYGCIARLAGSQEPQHAAAPSPGSPRATFAPGTAGAEPRSTAPVSRHCPYSWSSRARAAWGYVLPQSGQQNRHSGLGAGACPSRPRDMAFSCQGSQHRARGHQMHQTRCSHAGPALPACLCWAWHSQGHWDVPRWPLPSSLPHKAFGISLHVLLPTLCPTVCRNQRQPCGSSQGSSQGLF